MIVITAYVVFFKVQQFSISDFLHVKSLIYVWRIISSILTLFTQLIIFFILIVTNNYVVFLFLQECYRLSSMFNFYAFLSIFCLCNIDNSVSVHAITPKNSADFEQLLDKLRVVGIDANMYSSPGHKYSIPLFPGCTIIH